MRWKWPAAAASRSVIESARLPLTAPGRSLAEKGYITGGCKRNLEYLNDKVEIDKSIRERTDSKSPSIRRPPAGC